MSWSGDGRASCSGSSRPPAAQRFLRGNWLFNRVFSSCQDILNHCCYAWNRLVDQPWRIFLFGLRDWDHRF